MVALLRSSLFACVLVWALSAQAFQRLEVSDDKTITVDVPARELTRITFAASRIKAYRAVDGELDIKAKSREELLLVPLVPKPISLFLSSDSRTYHLVLNPVQKPLAETLSLVEPRGSVSTALAYNAEPLQTRTLRLITAMATRQAFDGVEPTRQLLPLALWAEAKLTRIALYDLPDLKGEIYELTNASAETMRLAERELYRRGVLAVAIVRHGLPPGGTTPVFVVRGADQ